MIEIPEEDFTRLFYRIFHDDERDYDERWEMIEQLIANLMGWS
jgi:hypothetical protein